MKSATEFRSLTELSEMAVQSLSPDEYTKFRDIHDILVLRRSIQKDVLNDYTINRKVSCTTCRSYGGAWIYCPILKQMLIIDGFDETGELHGCNAHNESGTIISESRYKHDFQLESVSKIISCTVCGVTPIWQCKYCGENENPKCHKCVREDGKSVSDELEV